jgi:tetratricopeptide (TPR) repeat protein
MSFYTQGIDAQPESQSILEALLCNRAACNLELSTHLLPASNAKLFLLPTSCLENYGSVLRDCATALSVNPKCIKAYYRSSLALLALERAKEALDCCVRCLAIDPENIGIKGVKERARNLKEKQDQKAAAEEDRKKQEGQKRKALSAALKVRQTCSGLNEDRSSRGSPTN